MQVIYLYKIRNIILHTQNDEKHITMDNRTIWGAITRLLTISLRSAKCQKRKSIEPIVLNTLSPEVPKTFLKWFN